jgi:hypothetical protein
MLFTTGQLRSAFGLSKQQWRSYRDALPPLSKDSGRAACFSASDLLATSVVHRVSGSLGMPLGSFTPLASPMFALLRTSPWPQVERSSLFLDFTGARVELADRERRMATVPVTLLVDLAPLVADLRRHLLAGVPDPQRDFAFPPMLAGTRQ